MSRLTADEALEMLFLDGYEDLDSGGELEIEDPEFPLPHYSDSDDSDDETVHHDPGRSTSTAHHLSPSDSDEGTDLDKNLGLGEGKQIQK